MTKSHTRFYWIHMYRRTQRSHLLISIIRNYLFTHNRIHKIFIKFFTAPSAIIRSSFFLSLFEIFEFSIFHTTLVSSFTLSNFDCMLSFDLFSIFTLYQHNSLLFNRNLFAEFVNIFMNHSTFSLYDTIYCLPMFNFRFHPEMKLGIYVSICLSIYSWSFF